jgi:hypothetical protein
MSSPLAPKLDFVLRALSMSRGRLASDLGVHKSAVGRWMTGAVEPSSHNLAQLTALVAARAPGFTGLDWDRDLDDLAEVLGVSKPGSARASAANPVPSGLQLPLFEQSQATTRLRGGAYEGLFRSTRPYAQHPGVFVHDHVMIRKDLDGVLRFTMSADGVSVDGWMLLLQNQLFCMGAEHTSGGCVFAILNGVNTVQAGVLDGLIMFCALDSGRTPTATAAIFERIGDLTGDRDVDDARFAELALQDAAAPEGSVPEAIRKHLVRNFGPDQMALGGDWLLQLPLIQSMSRGLLPSL